MANSRTGDPAESALCEALGIRMDEYAGRVDALADELGRIMRAHTDGVRSASDNPRLVNVLRSCIHTAACMQALAVAVLEHAGSPDKALEMLRQMPVTNALNLVLARRSQEPKRN